MFPILVDVAGLSIHTYGALGALGFAVGAGISLARAQALGLDRNRFADVIFWMSVAGLVGARLVYVVQNPGQLGSLGQLVDLRGGGLVFYGAALTGVPVGVGLLRRYGLPGLPSWDIFGTAAPIGHAISRVGCFAAGCCYGTPSSASWAVTYPADSGIAPPGVPLHPVQLYEAGGLLLIGLLTNALYGRRRFDGQVFLTYMLAYAVLRAFVELYRADPTRGYFLEPLLGPMVSFSLGMSLLIAALAVAGFVRIRRAAP